MKVKLLFVVIALVALMTSCRNNEADAPLISSVPSISETPKESEQIQESAAPVPTSETYKGDEQALSNTEYRLIRERDEIIDQIFSKSSQEDYENLITKQYPEKLFFEQSILFLRYHPARSYQLVLYMIEDDFPAECLRVTDENNAYSIYQTTEGGLVYCFYVKSYSDWVLYNAAYVKEPLTKNSFAEVKKGDSLAAVTKVDSACKAISDYILGLDGSQMTDYQTVHLLKDSLLVIDYTKSAQTFVIQNIRFFDDFKFKSESSDVIYSYKILEQDYLR